MSYKWVDQNPVHSPTARRYTKMDYNPNTHRTVLFGGANSFAGPTVFNDVWYWENKDWHQAFPTGTAPGGRSSHGFAYDPIHDEFLLFGGINGSGVLFNDTWALAGDLSTWTQKTPSTVPTGRYGHQLTYHPSSSSIYMMGGNSLGSDRYETYKWSGSNWILLSPANAPNGSFSFYIMQETPVALEPNSGKLIWFGQQWHFNPSTNFLTQIYFDGTDYTQNGIVGAISFGAFQFSGSFSFYDMAMHQNIGRTIIAGGVNNGTSSPGTLTQSLHPYPSTTWDSYYTLIAADPLSATQNPSLAPEAHGDVIAYRNDAFGVVKTMIFKKASSGQIIRRS